MEIPTVMSGVFEGYAELDLRHEDLNIVVPVVFGVLFNHPPTKLNVLFDDGDFFRKEHDSLHALPIMLFGRVGCLVQILLRKPEGSARMKGTTLQECVCFAKAYQA